MCRVVSLLYNNMGIENGFALSDIACYKLAACLPPFSQQILMRYQLCATHHAGAGNTAYNRTAIVCVWGII